MEVSVCNENDPLQTKPRLQSSWLSGRCLDTLSHNVTKAINYSNVGNHVRN